MNKFIKRYDSTYTDLSVDLHEEEDWLVGVLRRWEFAHDTTALAIDPVSGFLAAGTSHGSLFIYGRPGVSISLIVPDRIGVKFVQLSSSTFSLVCIDDHNRLHLWDLSSYGRPKYLAMAAFGQVNALTLSPSHCHALLSLQSGEVRTYDLQCRRKSSYIVPNLWKLYTAKTTDTSGFSKAPNPTVDIAVDVIIHPRNLNLVLIAYTGGVVLSDLTERSTLRVYELTIPAGAPGGVGYADPHIFTPRKPEVTSIVIHPTGHFFAVGYTDGIVAFWAVEDEEQPLMVRTLDEVDVNTMDPDMLERHLGPEKGKVSPVDKEPIFKMSWSSFSNSSDPRGGCTALSILGGLRASDASGLTVLWLPAFNPVESPTSVVENSLPAFFRSAMRDSLSPLDAYFYDTGKVVQDYLLIPKDSPHFNNSFDAFSILILSEWTDGAKGVKAFVYPPPGFAHPHTLKGTPDAEGGADVTDDLASTLLDMQLSSDPQLISLPWTLSCCTMGGQLHLVDRETYQNLVSPGNVATAPEVNLKGGITWNDEVDSKGSKFQPNRILVEHTNDLTVQFRDVSTQLLLAVRPEPITCEFPNPLRHLTIDVNATLLEPAVASRVIPTSSLPVAIHSVHYSTESLEVVVTLTTGDLLVYRLNAGKHEPAPYRESDDPAFVLLEHVLSSPTSRYSPFALFSPSQGRVTACAISDIGFLGVAYSNGSLFIVNLRGPSVLLFQNPNNKAKARQSLVPLGHRSIDPVSSLTWAISPNATDKQSQLRLVAVRSSGDGEVYTLLRGANSTWTCPPEFSKFDGLSEPLAEGTYVVDHKAGTHCRANRHGLANVFDPILVRSTYLLTCGLKGAKTFNTVDGDRIGRVDWGTKVGNVRAVQLVEKLGSCVLVAFTDRYETLTYSVPHLELICNLPIPVPPSVTAFTIDKSGDFFGWGYHSRSGLVQSATYGTLFNQRRSLPIPDVDLGVNRGSLPAQPQPVSMGPASFLGAWLTFGNQSISGTQVDELLGGPDRPIPELPQRPDDERALLLENMQQKASSLAASAQATHNSLYERLSSALSDRGEMLGNLEDQFNSLEQGSRSMAANAKRLAAQQTAKSWFSFG